MPLSIARDALGSWFLVPGSGFLNPHSSFLVPRLKFPRASAGFMILAASMLPSALPAARVRNRLLRRRDNPKVGVPTTTDTTTPFSVPEASRGGHALTKKTLDKEMPDMYSVSDVHSVCNTNKGFQWLMLSWLGYAKLPQWQTSLLQLWPTGGVGTMTSPRLSQSWALAQCSVPLKFGNG